MKRIYFLFTFLFLGVFFSNAQKAIANNILSLQKQNTVFEPSDVFQENKDFSKQKNYRLSATDAEVLKINLKELEKIQSKKSDNIELEIPFKGQVYRILLNQNKLFTNDFKVSTSQQKDYVYTPGVYYNGIVNGNKNSLVAFSFFKDDVVGVISTPEEGNIVIGKAKDSQDFVIYSDKTLTGKNPFVCGVDELKENRNIPTQLNSNKNSLTPTTNCVRVYYEVAYKPYQNNGSNVTTTTNWMTAVHNNIQTLYTNDEIRVALSEIFIWTIADPYTGTFGQNLSAFRLNRPTFNGDLAHLVNSPSTTSVAYLNSLCTTFKHAYSGISQSYQQVPTYSWTIAAMTHEMGHSLGSPHTHACAWNGNDTAIDGCGPASGNSEGCNAPLPAQNSGTIMSYCHLIGSVGMNLASGFGPQPGALIRQMVDTKGCLGSNCTISCALNINNLQIVSTTTNSVNSSFEDNIGTTWKYQVLDMQGNRITSGNSSVRNININGLQPNTYYVLQVGNDCSAPTAFQKSVVFLTDADWCNPTVNFLDSGGATGNYTNSQNIIKTFYPSSPTQKLKLTFSQFDLELDYDFMSIYDGENTNAPLFANGSLLSGNTNPGPFNATNSAGAITVEFNSDGGLVLGGWNAKFECVTLGTSNVSSNTKLEIYPNPTTSKVNVKSSDSILNYRLIDASAKLIDSKTKINANGLEIDLTSLPKGVYILSVTTKNGIVQEKIIKK